MNKSRPSFYEFFCGGGMVRAALDGWDCGFANDIDPKKRDAYVQNWGDLELVPGDINNVHTGDLPGQADLAWASFPCQDLSLAGNYKGLNGERSGTFWAFWKLMRNLGRENRAPRAIVIENVCGTITSHRGKDFEAIAAVLAEENYQFGAMVVDAKHWVPQSRPRLFFVAISANTDVDHGLETPVPNMWYPPAILNAYETLPQSVKPMWKWWALAAPSKRNKDLIDIIEEAPSDVDWHSPADTKRLQGMMSDVNRLKVDAAKVRSVLKGTIEVGAVYKRTRNGNQCAEVRFDGLAGCLRTPVGGSSRQTIIVIDKGVVKSRLLSSREAARLMGLDDSYKLPKSYNQAYKLCGDGVVVPVVNHLIKDIVERALLIAPPAFAEEAELARSKFC